MKRAKYLFPNSTVFPSEYNTMINMEIKLQTHSIKIMALEVGQMLQYATVCPC